MLESVGLRGLFQPLHKGLNGVVRDIGRTIMSQAMHPLPFRLLAPSESAARLYPARSRRSIVQLGHGPPLRTGSHGCGQLPTSGALLTGDHFATPYLSAPWRMTSANLSRRALGCNTSTSSSLESISHSSAQSWSTVACSRNQSSPPAGWLIFCCGSSLNSSSRLANMGDSRRTNRMGPFEPKPGTFLMSKCLGDWMVAVVASAWAIR